MAVPLALISALKRDTVIDQTIRTVTVTFLSTPSFWVGIILLILLGVKFPIFPVGGIGQDFCAAALLSLLARPRHGDTSGRSSNP